ncbi:Uncharacterised protein [Klebsiella pneumoniae]|nr:Uncharacterised protein [Klebsiella pneumoniae]
MLKQRQRREDRQQSVPVMQDHITQFSALAAVQLVTEIALNVHQHVSVILPRSGFFQDGHQFVAIGHEKRVQIVPLVQ